MFSWVPVRSLAKPGSWCSRSALTDFASFSISSSLTSFLEAAAEKTPTQHDAPAPYITAGMVLDRWSNVTLRMKVKSSVLSEERSCLTSGIHPYFTAKFKIPSTNTAKVAFYIPTDGKQAVDQQFHQFFHLHEPWSLVCQAQQVSKKAAISHFHRCPPSYLLCDLDGQSRHCPSVSTSFFFFFFPYYWSGVAGVSAISDTHWKWQVNLVQLLPVSVPL